MASAGLATKVSITNAPHQHVSPPFALLNPLLPQIHRPGWADVIAEARLPGMFTSGYRCVLTGSQKQKQERNLKLSRNFARSEDRDSTVSVAPDLPTLPLPLPQDDGDQHHLQEGAK